MSSSYVLKSDNKNMGHAFSYFANARHLLSRRTSNFELRNMKYVLKYGSEEKGSSLCKCSILLGFIMSKKQERLRSELLSEDKITNLLGFLT